MQVRRKLQEFSTGEQDPGKDLFAILFLSFFLLLLVAMSVPRQAPAPEPTSGGGDNVTLQKDQVVVIAKRDGQIEFIVGDQRYDRARFFKSLPTLPVFMQLDSDQYVRLSASDTLNAVEWEKEKKRIRRAGFGVITVSAVPSPTPESDKPNEAPE